jgi:hypothetical protein
LGGILRNQLGIDFQLKTNENIISSAVKSKVEEICKTQKIYPKFVISKLSI